MVRSILAVVAGYFTLAVLTSLTTYLVAYGFGLAVAEPGAQPPLVYVVVNLVYSTVYAGVGGYVAARVATHRPVRHALALAALLVVLGLVYTAVAINIQPLWYLLGLPLLGAPAAVLGGYVHARRAAAGKIGGGP